MPWRWTKLIKLFLSQSQFNVLQWISVDACRSVLLWSESGSVIFQWYIWNEYSVLILCYWAYIEQAHCTYDNNRQIRLVNGSNNASGRVEICLGGVWGTVCDDGWDSNDANTVCRQLGYNHGMITTYTNLECIIITIHNTERAIPTTRAYFGEGSGPIYLSRVQCTNHGMILVNCIIDNTEIYRCDHSEDAGVICMGKVTHPDKCFL